MAWTEEAVGPTTTDGTEQTLATKTTNGTYVFDINTKNMVNNDTIEIRIKTKIDASDSSDVAYFATYANVQAEPKKYSVAIPIANGEIIVTLKRTSGTDRSYRWTLKRQ
jgi:hypothetical protein